MGVLSFKRLWTGLILASALAAQSAEPAPPVQPSLAQAHILLLNSYSPGRPGFDRVNEAFVRRLRASGVPLEHIHIEFLHLNQPNAEMVTPARRAMLLAQYGNQRLDLVVAIQQPALNFVMDELESIAPKAPLLTDSSPTTVQLAGTQRAIFKYMMVPDVGATVKEVMQLLPRTRRVVIPGGVAEADRAFQRQAEVELAPWLRRVQIEFLQNMSWPEQLRYINNLSPDTVVVSGMYNRDRDGYTLPTIDAARDVMRSANVPVFVLFDTVVGEGAVGGAVRNLQQSGQELADNALAVLEGRQGASGAVTKVPTGPVQSLYDWRQLARWNIDPSALQGATILNRPPSLWQAYRGEVLGAGAVMVLMAGLLAALLVQRRRLAQAELASRESKERFRALVEYAPEAILVLDLDEGRFVDANGEAEQLFGHTRAALLGMHPSALYAPGQFDGAEPLESVRRNAERAWAGEHMVFERTVLRPDGATVPVEVKLRRLPTSGKRWLRCSYEDVSARKQADAELKDHRHRLEELVQQRTAALTEATAEAEAAVQAKGVFLANMSHELRTPLQSMIELSGTLANSPSMFDQERHHLAVINRSGQNLLGLIDDILELSRSESEHAPAASENVDLQALLREAIETVRSRIETPGVTLALACGSLPSQVLADGRRLRQVLVILLSHAARPLERGGITLAVDAQPAGSRRWRLSFLVRGADIGIGMGSPGLAATDNVPNSADPGLGICREFVRLIGSRLVVRSQPGQGNELGFAIEVDESSIAVPLTASTISP